jgi:hypothetical protein
MLRKLIMSLAVLAAAGVAVPAASANPEPRSPCAHGNPTDLCDRILVVQEPAGANCALGGIKIVIVHGALDPDAVVRTARTGKPPKDDPADEAFYVCNGLNGVPGPPGPVGPPGPPGPAGVTVVLEPPGVNCQTGGVKITTADGTFYVCNGVPVPTPQSCISTRIASWHLVVRKSVRVSRVRFSFNGKATTFTRFRLQRVHYRARVDLRGLPPGVYGARIRYNLRKVGSRTVRPRSKVHLYRVGCPGQYGPGGLNVTELTVL